MKYLVLRKRPYSGEDPFTEMVAAGGGHDSGLPFDVHSQELEDRDVGDLRRDPNVDVVPSIYFTLIKPLEVSSADLGPIGARAWGIEAVGAGSSPQNGEGVTVAVLDTGIDKTHQAFSGLEFDGENLKDFTVDERGGGRIGRRCGRSRDPRRRHALRSGSERHADRGRTGG